MRVRVQNGGVTVQAIAGNHTIYFGFDLDDAARSDCMGFAIYRVDHEESEEYWLSGFKTFESVVPNPDPKVWYRTREHPIQSFYWGDYTTKPGYHYTYRIVPRYGPPGNLQDRSGVEATLDVATSDPRLGKHGVYFNRGVAASQAYARKFGAPPKDLPPDKRAEALEWLSRGLLEAIVGFIGRASSPQFALRAAVYEFTQKEVLEAFRTAHDSGADVQIVYHAKADSGGDGNRKAIAEVGLDPAMVIEREHAEIAHNKFIVLCEKDAGGALHPVSVWTGSTNLSQGGILGHSNVGHAVRDPAIAAQFLEYWEQLRADPQVPALRDWVSPNSPFPVADLDAQGLHTIFSPRHGVAPLAWYAQRFVGATVMASITAPFGLTTTFEAKLESYGGPALHYVILDKEDTNQDQWAKYPRVLVSVGASGGPDEMLRWAQEELTNFNSWVKYVHTKVLLVDPLSADPTVITGSANFSDASTDSNDENMLVIRGDRRVADVYFTEFVRIFNHFYARYWASRLGEDTADAREHSFLAETPGWQTPYFTAGNPKQLQRVLLSSQVEANE